MAGKGCRVVEILTSSSRVFVVCQTDDGHTDSMTGVEKRQFVRNLVGKNIREYEAVFYIGTSPTDLVVYFPCDMPQYMSKELKSSSWHKTLSKQDADIIDSRTLLVLENVYILQPFCERPPKQKLWINKEVHIGDIDVKAFRHQDSASGMFGLTIESEGQQIVIANDQVDFHPQSQ